MTTIRPFQEEDTPRLLEVLAATFSEYGMRFDPDGYDRDVREVMARYPAPQAAFWTAVDEAGRAVGFVGADELNPGEVELHRLYIDASARGAGLGGRLVDAVEAWARARAARTVALWSDVRFCHAHAIYARRGYALSGQRTIGDPDRSVEFGFRRALGMPVAPVFPDAASLVERKIEGADLPHRARMIAAALLDSRSLVRAGRVSAGGHVLPGVAEVFAGARDEDVAALVTREGIVGGLAWRGVRRLHPLFAAHRL